MDKQVLSSGSYLPSSGEERFHRNWDIGGRRECEPEGSGYLAEKRQAGQTNSKNPRCWLWRVCYNLHSWLSYNWAKGVFSKRIIFKEKWTNTVTCDFFFFNNFHSVTLNLVYFKNPAFLVSNLMEPLVFIVKDLGLVCFLGGGGNEEVAW